MGLFLSSGGFRATRRPNAARSIRVIKARPNASQNSKPTACLAPNALAINDAHCPTSTQYAASAATLDAASQSAAQ
jgi:hypothetical protein